MVVNAMGPLQPNVRFELKKQPKPTQADILYPATKKKPANHLAFVAKLVATDGKHTMQTGQHATFLWRTGLSEVNGSQCR